MCDVKLKFTVTYNTVLYMRAQYLQLHSSYSKYYTTCVLYVQKHTRTRSAHSRVRQTAQSLHKTNCAQRRSEHRTQQSVHTRRQDDTACTQDDTCARKTTQRAPDENPEHSEHSAADDSSVHDSNTVQRHVTYGMMIEPARDHHERLSTLPMFPQTPPHTPPAYTGRQFTRRQLTRRQLTRRQLTRRQLTRRQRRR